MLFLRINLFYRGLIKMKESKLRTSKKINRNSNYFTKEKQIISIILKLLIIFVLITITINLINYINILLNSLKKL